MALLVREFGSEYHWQANQDFLRPEGSNFQDAKKYRSGRDSLKAVAAKMAGKYSSVLLPALCCQSMVAPFTLYGIQPVFYRLKADYTADLNDLQSKMTGKSLLLYGSYFGIDPIGQAELMQLKKDFPEALFLEDRTQDILIPRKGGFIPDVTIASIRKWTAIGDGGLLWSETYDFEPGVKNSRFADMRKTAMVQKSQYLANGDSALKDSYRHLLGQANELLDGDKTVYAMTEDSATLLARLDTQKMLSLRQANANVLFDKLDGKVSLITKYPERSTLYFPILVENQRAVQSALAKKGIYCPVIWPVPEEATGVCPVAHYTAEHMLGVPCDHRYTWEDMEFIADEIVRILNAE